MKKHLNDNLKSLFPEIAAEWDKEGNSGFYPESISAFSKTKVWWKCSVCGYNWETGVYTRTRMKCGCPKCSQIQSSKNRIKRIISEKGSFASNFPDLLYLWDYEKNEVSPEDITPVSNKLYWWICSKGHSWESNIGNLKKAKNCPICFNRKLLKGYNDLQTRFPIIAKQWDFNKNDGSPDEILFGSGKSIWWICEKCGTEWKATPATRTRLLTGCPTCKNATQISRPEKAIAYYLIKAGYSIEENYKLYKNYSLDIFIPSKNIAIEYDGQEWHKNTERDLIKNKQCVDRGIKLYRVREPELEDLNSSSIDIRVKKLTSTLDYMTDVVIELFSALKIDYIDIDVKRDEIDILSYMNNYEIKHSIVISNPEIIKEWDYKKNKNLKPEFFSRGSNTKVWWVCSLGHNYKQSISSRTTGCGCPYCGSRKVLSGFNDLESCHPELMVEWNYEKNINVFPNKILSKSGSKVWWKCLKGHEWEARPLDRVLHGNGCPYCSNKKILAGFNDLATTNPDIVLEWDFERNDISPQQIFAGSNKKLFWICKECGNKYETSVANRKRGRGCPICGLKKRGVSARNNRINKNGSIVEKATFLLDEWDYNLNSIKPNEIEPNSNIKVWWICHKGHNYESTPNNRMAGKGCPYCSNQKVLIGYNDLETTNNELAAEWNYDRNTSLPNQFTSGTNQKVWWICSKGHEWQASISSRNHGVGCPICSGKIVLKGFNDLLSTHPDISKEWNYDKNGKLAPDQVTAGSNKKVWWMCSKGHEWITAVCLRTSQNTGCPYCTGRKILIGFNDLNSVYPKLTKEWDYDKNEISPNEVVYGSGKRVWWICPCCGNNWASSVVNRTKKKSGCPKCKYNWYKDDQES